MPEIKHNFTGGKMNKDLDERLVPNGEYRDAMNIQVATSEGSEVGTVQNILGNIEGCTYTFSNPIPSGSSTVGSISDEKNDTLYWFVAGKKEKLNDLGDADLETPYFERDLIMRRTSNGCEPVFVDQHTVVVDNTFGETTLNANTPHSFLGENLTTNYIEVGMFVTGIGSNGQSNTVMINNINPHHPNPGISFNNDLYLQEQKYKVGNEGQIYNGPFKYLYFHKDRVLNFEKDNQITGINIIDDILLWTDNNTEPKKINIPRSLEGTHSSGLLHTKLINNSLRPEVNLTTVIVPIKEEHITVIKKSPNSALNIDLQTAREPGKNYSGAMRITSNQSNLSSSFLTAGGSPIQNGNFSQLSKGDTIYIKIEEKLDGSANPFALYSLKGDDALWEPGDKVVLKEFNNGAPPSIPIGNDYRIKGVIESWSGHSAAGPGRIALKITSIVGDPPIADPNTGILKYAVDIFGDSDKVFEFKFPRFSYRYKYEDGEYSNYAPFTEPAFSPGSFDYHPKKGYNLGMTNRTTSIILRDFITSDMPQDVIEIDLLYKDDISSNIYIINTIRPRDGDLQNAWYSIPSGSTISSGVYKITSETIYAAVASNQLLRPWDNVPRKALAQEVTGNRVVYGNYVQNYDLSFPNEPFTSIYPKFTSIISPGLNTLDKFGRDNIKSIKSLREYQLGVVFIDKYGRETPVISNETGTFKLDKTYGDDENRLQAKISDTKIPNHFKYFKFFIKETSGEYYNMAMDRFYDAEDGNYWLAFPSSERNKIDIDTFLILKKAADSNEIILEPARYKILAIENEAPDFIKTRRYNIGEAVGIFGDTINNSPVNGTTSFEFFSAEFDKGSAGEMHEIINHPLHVEFEDIATGEISNRYRITEINKSDLEDGDNKFFVKLDKPLEEDVEFLLDNINTPTRIRGSIKIRLYKYVVENKPQFDGRFFAKIYADDVFNQYIDLPQKLVEKEYRVTKEKRVYYMAENHVDRHNAYTFGANTAVYSGSDPSTASGYGTIIQQLTNPRNLDWIQKSWAESEEPGYHEVEWEATLEQLEHRFPGETMDGYYGNQPEPSWVTGSSNAPPGGYVGDDVSNWGAVYFYFPFYSGKPTGNAAHSALFHNITPWELPEGGYSDDPFNPPVGEQENAIITWTRHTENLFEDSSHGTGIWNAYSSSYPSGIHDFLDGRGDSYDGGTRMHRHGDSTHTGQYIIEGRDAWTQAYTSGAISNMEGWGRISDQGFPGHYYQNTNKPADFEFGWSNGHRSWDGKTWHLRQGQGSLSTMKEDDWGSYQILHGEFGGQVTSAVGWYNIPSSYRDSGAEMLGEFWYDWAGGMRNEYIGDMPPYVKNKAGFVPIARSNGIPLNQEDFTRHELAPDGVIKQDLYRFIPPTVDDWYYFTAYFATYEKRSIYPKYFKNSPFFRGTSGVEGEEAGVKTELNDLAFIDQDTSSLPAHRYFDVLGEKGNVQEDPDKYEDVWFIDDCAYVGTNSYNQESWGKNYANGNKYSFHNYPNLEINENNGKIIPKADPERGITTTTLSAVEDGSMISLSFGGIDPETREPQSYYKAQGNSPTGRFEQFLIEGAESESDNFWDLAHSTRTKYSSEALFINKLTSGRQFRWKEDPTEQVYTISAQVNETNRLRYDSNPLDADGRSIGGSHGTHKDYDKRFIDQGEPTINAQWPLNIGNRIENFFKNYKIQIVPEITGWNPIQGGELGVIPGGYKVDKYSTDNGITLTNLTVKGTITQKTFIIEGTQLENAWDTNHDKKTPLLQGMLLTQVGNGSGVYTVQPHPLLVKEVKKVGSDYKITFTGYKSNPAKISYQSGGFITANDELIFEQPIMNGLSVNSASNITENNPGIGMGAVGYTMQFIEPIEKEQLLPENPSIWETEPKESTDLDIYYEISGNNPINIDSSTIKTAVPIGSTITGWYLGSPSGSYEVTGYVNDEIQINSMDNSFLTMAININPSNGNLVGSNVLVVNKPDGSSFETAIDFAWLVPLHAAGINLLVNRRIKLFPSLWNSLYTLNWYNCYAWGNGVESNRIRDNFNLPFISNGVKVSTTLEGDYKEEHRKYGLIYSGIYNSMNGVNNLNQFIQAEPITKDINPIYGSIQKLHSQSTAEGDLVVLCEDKILKILANKDALYNADGNLQLTATNNVLGQTIPYSGEHGISTNPESFASEAYRVYFADKIRGKIMRLSKDGLTPISDSGMRDWFKDNLKLSNKIVGSYDDKKDEYNITLKDISKTITFREDVRGWVSFKSFFPENAISMANDYYTFLDGNLYKHHAEFEIDGITPVNRNTFYKGEVVLPFTESSINIIVNTSPGIIKSFSTLNYEGSQTKVDINTLDNQYFNLKSKKGWYAESFQTDKEKGSLKEFVEKEGKWFGYLKGQSVIIDKGDIANNEDGSSTFDLSSFAIQGIGTAVSGGVDPSWNCDDDGCYDPGDGNGQYSSFSACQEACGVTPTWNCVNGECEETYTGSGTYSSLSTCQWACGESAVPCNDLLNYLEGCDDFACWVAYEADPTATTSGCAAWASSASQFASSYDIASYWASEITIAANGGSTNNTPTGGYLNASGEPFPAINAGELYDILTNCCSGVEPTPCPAIGDWAHGGWVFFVNDTGSSCTGLVVAPGGGIDIPWGCFGNSVTSCDNSGNHWAYNCGTAIGTGAQNTIEIEAGCTTPGTAADICANYTSDGYNDWFLPSRQELAMMRVNLHQQGLGPFSPGNFNPNFLPTNLMHWSSSEDTDINSGYNNPTERAWAVDFGSASTFPSGAHAAALKTNLYTVRPIRAF